MIDIRYYLLLLFFGLLTSPGYCLFENDNFNLVAARRKQDDGNNNWQPKTLLPRYRRNIPETDPETETKKPRHNDRNRGPNNLILTDEEPQVSLNFTEPAINLQDGGSFSVLCNSSGASNRVVWLRGNQNIGAKDHPPHNRYHVYVVPDNKASVLVFDKVTKASEGTYRCGVYVQTTRKYNTVEFQLKVSDPIPIVYLSTTLAVISKYPNQNYNITCFGNSNNITWTDPSNRTITQSHRDGTPYVKRTERESRLIFSNITGNMSGTYRCDVDLYGQVKSVEFTLYVGEEIPSLQFSTHSNATEIEVKSSYSVVCEGKNFTNHFWKDASRIPISFSNSQKIYQEYSADGTKLVIAKAALNHSGIYTCVASIDDIHFERTFTIKVIRKPNLSHPIFEPPISGEIWREVGQSLSITCRGDTDRISWLGPPKGWIITTDIEKSIHAGDVRKEYDDEYVNTLEMNNITESDAGEYVCNVSDPERAQWQHRSFKLVTVVPLHFVHNTSDYQVLETHSVALDCGAKGVPTPKIIWYFNRSPIDDTIQHTILSGGELLIRNSRYNYTGDYICEVHQYIQDTQKYNGNRALSLRVKHKPVFPDGPVVIMHNYRNRTINIPCNDISYPKARYSWRRDGQLIGFDKVDNFITISFEQTGDFDSYICTATNDFGSVVQNITVVESERPDVPRLKLIKVCGTDVYLSITSEKETVVNFTVDYAAEDESAFNSYNFSRGDKSEYVLQSLRPNTPYVLRAASVNLVEPGEYTQNLTIKTGNGATFRYKLSAFVVILFLSLHSHRIFSVKLA